MQIDDDRYIKVTRWAKARYRKNGVLILWANGKPSAWTRIERLAFDRYIMNIKKQN